jgi:predicted nucleic acid-binding protein
MIIGDTSVLSHFLRRAADRESDVSATVERLIETNEVALLGIVRQELLSGIKRPSDFDRIKTATEALPLFLADDDDHTTAARFFNTCRSKGIQGSPIDFLICAMAVRLTFPIYTTDPDFVLYEPHIPIELHRP